MISTLFLSVNRRGWPPDTLDARTVQGGALRSSIADYEVLEPLQPPAPVAIATAAYVARPPRRLGLGDPRVVVSELPEFETLVGAVTEAAAAPSDRLVAFLEAGPDPEADGGGGYLVTEHPFGGTLAHPVTELTLIARVRAVADAARGAHALHQAGHLHGAIRPEAIWLTERGAALTRPVEPSGSSTPGLVTRVVETEDLELLGPDLLGSNGRSRATDVWALGVTLHRVLSGRSLYPQLAADDPVAGTHRILFSRPVVDESVTGGVVAVIEACVASEPAARPATAEEVADALSSWADQAEGAGR
jgi:serine/threonine-protein kinase